jgi:O-acetyl-ADP-ribose deacetylase (regulator of RNase III)
MKVSIVCGDITGFQGDVVVNAANPPMLGGGGVDGAIHRAAGPLLKQLCERVPTEGGVRCPVGSVRPTPAADLTARWVFHTAAPIKSLKRSGELRPGETDGGDEDTLHQQMRDIFKKVALLALGMDLKTIAIPALGCGIYGWSHEEVADIAMGWAKSYGQWPLEVTIYLFPADAYPTWVAAARKFEIEGF